MHPLVDAFYKGRAQFKKITKVYFDHFTKPKKACHLGAIYYGMYGKTAHDISDLDKDYPELSNIVSIPCDHAASYDDPNGQVGSIMIHLNDEHTAHSWPDKTVAEWLEKALKNG